MYVNIRRNYLLSPNNRVRHISQYHAISSLFSQCRPMSLSIDGGRLILNSMTVSTYAPRLFVQQRMHQVNGHCVERNQYFITGFNPIIC